MKGALASQGWFYVHECRCVCVRVHERWGWQDGDLSFGEGDLFFRSPPFSLDWPCTFGWGRANVAGKPTVLKLRVKGGRASLAPSPAQKEHQIVEEMTGGSE